MTQQPATSFSIAPSVAPQTLAKDLKMRVSIPLIIILFMLCVQCCSGPSGLELQQQLTDSIEADRDRLVTDNKPTGSRHIVHASAHGWQFDLSWFEARVSGCN